MGAKFRNAQVILGKRGGISYQIDEKTHVKMKELTAHFLNKGIKH